MHLKKQIALRLPDDALRRLDRLAKRYGGKAKAIEAALRRLDESDGQMSREALMAEIERRLK